MVKKKKVLEHNKVMNQSTNYQLKHKYFQKLKELDDYSCKDDDFAKKMTDFEEMIESSKYAIKDLEKKEA